MTPTASTSDGRPWDAVIVGGGAAGLSAAQALGRSLRRTLVIDSGSPRNRFADRMHNVLGLDGTPPLELLARGRAESESYGVEFRVGTVSGVREGASSLELTLEQASGEATTVHARQLIAATGVTDVLPPLPGLAEHWGRGVYHCPYCHGWEVRGQRIGVAVFTPLGMHQVKLLTQWTGNLTVFLAGAGEVDAETVRMLEARGVAIEWEPLAEITMTDSDAGAGTRAGAGSRAGDTGDTSDTGDTGERGARKLSGVRTVTGREYALDAVFTASSLLPHDEFLSGLGLARTETPVGSFLDVDFSGRTSNPRVWAVGNLAQPMASVPLAAASGTMAGGAVNFALVEEDLASGVAAAASAAGGAGKENDDA